MIIDNNVPTPFENVKRVLQEWLPANSTTTKSNHVTKILTKILRKCKNLKLPLIDRKEFLLKPNNFTPFVFSDVSLTNLPARVSEDQNSVRHEPTYKRQKIKLKVNLLKTTSAMRLQGDTGANTSATDQLELLHNYRPFKKKENVGVYFQNKDTADVRTLQRCVEGLSIPHMVLVLYYPQTIIYKSNG